MGLVVLTGCGYLGIVFAGKFKSRVRQLMQLENTMVQLEFDIDFANITLEESFLRIGKNQDGVLKDMLLYISKRLQKDPGCELKRLWQRAVQKYNESLNLTDGDIQIITDFFKTLGSGDREKEKNNIRITALRLKMAVEEAKIEAEKNSKMYRGLGFLSGIFLVIVLL